MTSASRWKALLLSLCAVAFVAVVGTVGDQWGFGGRPWFGFYDASNVPTTQPFIFENSAPTPGGATDRAGLRDGDRADLRELPFDARFWEMFQPIATQPMLRRFHRGDQTITTTFHASTVWEGATKWKLANQIPELIAKIWLFLCALLISIRSSSNRDGRILALVLLGTIFADSIGPASIALPNAQLSAVFQVLNDVIFAATLVLLVAQTSLFGVGSRWRTGMEWLAYASSALGAFGGIAAIVGLETLWFDPLPYLFGQFWYVEGAVTVVVVAACAIVAVATTPESDRPRAIWLLLPVSLALAVSQILSGLNGLISDWYLFIAALATSNLALALGAGAITYALLNRRVLDFGFVINRALVMASVSAVTVGTFAVLETIIAIFFSKADRNAVIYVSAAVTLVLGLAMPRLYRMLEGAVERYLFAREYRARMQVSRLASGLPYAESTEALDATLTKAIPKAFNLQSAAVFRRDSSGKFIAVASHGWRSDEHLEPIDAQRLVMSLQGENTMVSIEDEYLTLDRLPSGDREPAVALGLTARHSLIGFVLYSGRFKGIRFDPDERALLLTVSREASRGYDAVELASRVEVAYQARIEAESEAKETLRRTNAALERINEAQARFMPNEFLRFLGKTSITDVALGDSVQGRMTVLFSDIRSFTTLSEGMTPAGIFSFLNRYLQRAEPIISEHGGFIDKYIGDAIMGIFPTSADDALLAGIELQREVRVLNRKLKDEGLPPFAIGVGVHTGDLMLGTIGGRNRMETTVIADAVNAASRLESATKTFGCGIVLSRETRDSLSDPERFMLRNLGPLHVKGKHESLDVFEAFDSDPAESIVHKQQTLAEFAAAVAAYTVEDYRTAHAAFTHIAQASLSDNPARYYAGLSEEMLGNAVAR